MAGRKPESYGCWFSPICKELAGRPVDGNDVVGIEGVAGTEKVSGDTKTQSESLFPDSQLLWQHSEHEHPPGEHVKNRDRREEPSQCASGVLRWRWRGA